MSAQPIDVWNIDTLDEPLLRMLRQEAALVRNYKVTDLQQFLAREASDHTDPYPENPYSGDFHRFMEAVGREMDSRVIRAWHYTRLVDEEVAIIRQQGFHVSTLASLRRRLDARVAAGSFSADVADALYAASPFHEKGGTRPGKFYMTSNPVPVDDSGVKLLLGHWGGEATYFWQRDQRLIDIVTAIGRPRVFEIAVPVAESRSWYSAGKAVVNAFARRLEVPFEPAAFDLNTQADLPASTILAIHTKGGAKYRALARGYPVEFKVDEDRS